MVVIFALCAKMVNLFLNSKAYELVDRDAVALGQGIDPLPQ
jgi:hypothetical protein